MHYLKTKSRPDLKKIYQLSNDENTGKLLRDISDFNDDNLIKIEKFGALIKKFATDDLYILYVLKSSDFKAIEKIDLNRISLLCETIVSTNNI
jgi:hypothetical protein